MAKQDLVNAKSYNIATKFKEMMEDESPEIWVFNVTNQLKKFDKKGGSISIPIISTATNENTTLVIPNTWVPVNLCEQADKKDILTSQRFRNMVTNQYIRIVEGETANEFYEENDEDALEELQVARQKINNNFNSDSEDINSGTTDDPNEVKLEDLANSQVVAFVKDKQLSPSEKYSHYRRLKHGLSENDREYIREYCEVEKILNELDR